MRDPERRHTTRGKNGPVLLPPTDPARLERRPLFPNMVYSATRVPRVLIPTRNNKKIGSHFSVDMEWQGFPIYSLSLPERTTCPERPCWEYCYGNRMNHARRILPDNDLLVKLNIEIDALASNYPAGFAVRLHVLGDFASLAYTNFWIDAIRATPALYCFGFTAHDPASEIGALIDAESFRWDRFRIRFSYGEGDRSAHVRPAPPRKLHDEGQTCPADTEHDALNCGKCGLCVSQKGPIIFKLH